MNLLDDAYESKHRKNLAQLEGRVERILNELARQLADPLRRWESGTKTAIPSIRREVEEALSGARTDIQTLIENSISNAWNLSNDKNNRLVDSYLKGVTADSAVVSSMHQLNLAALDSFLRRSERGMNLSKRVWGITRGFENQMELYVGSGITSGQSAAAIARDIRKLLKNPDAVVRRVKNETGKLVMTQATRDYHPGPGVYRSSFKNALRLARTETNIAYRLADSERRAQIPFILGVEVHLSNAHPRPDICDSMAGEYPKGFVFTGWHSQCICYTTSILASREQFNAYLRDGTPIPKAGFIRNIPEKAKEYLAVHDEKLKKSGLYWIDDNFTKSWSLKRETLGYEKRRGRKSDAAALKNPPQLSQKQIASPVKSQEEINMDRIISEYNATFKALADKYGSENVYTNSTDRELDVLMALDAEKSKAIKLMREVVQPVKPTATYFYNDSDPDFIKETLEIMKREECECYGFRVPTDLNTIFNKDYLKKLGIEYAHKDISVGDKLDPSWVWIDGDLTQKVLKGTSSIGVVAKGNIREQVIRALNISNQYVLDSDEVLLIGGKFSGAGYDDGEYVIKNARVLRKFSRKRLIDLIKSLK